MNATQARAGYNSGTITDVEVIGGGPVDYVIRLTHSNGVEEPLTDANGIVHYAVVSDAQAAQLLITTPVPA